MTFNNNDNNDNNNNNNHHHHHIYNKILDHDWFPRHLFVM